MVCSHRGHAVGAAPTNRALASACSPSQLPNYFQVGVIGFIPQTPREGGVLSFCFVSQFQIARPRFTADQLRWIGVTLWVLGALPAARREARVSGKQPRPSRPVRECKTCEIWGILGPCKWGLVHTNTGALRRKLNFGNLERALQLWKEPLKR